jgi:hypothetical protein
LLAIHRDLEVPNHFGAFETPPGRFDKNMSPHLQDEVQRDSIEDPESFWGQQAEHLSWHRKPDSVLSRTTKTLASGSGTRRYPHWEWFSGGQISTCYNCVDRHVEAGNGQHPAVFYDSPVTKSKQTITYAELQEKVEVTAGALREEGIKKGDVVLVYSGLFLSPFFSFWRYLFPRPTPLNHPFPCRIDVEEEAGCSAFD